MKKFLRRILSIKCNTHLINEGWVVQGIIFRHCINCELYEDAGATLDRRNFKLLTSKNSIHVDGRKLK